MSWTFVINLSLIGNALTELSAPSTAGAIQADGSVKPEPTFDAKYVAESILHVAELPLNVTVLTYNIMYVLLIVQSPDDNTDYRSLLGQR